MPAPRRRLRPAGGGLPDLSVLFGELRTELGVEVEFDPPTQAEAVAAAAAPAVTHRADLTALPFVTLDPPGSTDLDQAMHLSRSGTGYLVRYAIADVAAFVAPGGHVDRAAHRRVTTIYCPDRRVPLHPPVLSEGVTSLLPDQDRPAVVWTMRVAADGSLLDVAVERAWVRSRARLDYPSEQRRLDAGVAADDVLALLAELGQVRAALEVARGGVSLGRPEQEVVETPDGWDLRLRAALPIEEHNAQLSLMTGMAAAGLMLGGRVGVLRTMPPAEPADLARLRRQAATWDVPWPAGASYGQVLRGADHSRPQTAAFLAAATGLFRGAGWTTFDGAPPTLREHAAIAAPYAHVTAPLRRLVDRYGLEVCLALSAGRPVPEWVHAALPTLGETAAAGARRGAAVDRACTDLVEAVLLAGQVGRTFRGVVLDGRTVQLREPAVVARLDGTDLPAGEEVDVRLVLADPRSRSVRFELADASARRSATATGDA